MASRVQNKKFKRALREKIQRLGWPDLKISQVYQELEAGRKNIRLLDFITAHRNLELVPVMR